MLSNCKRHTAIKHVVLQMNKCTTTSLVQLRTAIKADVLQYVGLRTGSLVKS